MSAIFARIAGSTAPWTRDFGTFSGVSCQFTEAVSDPETERVSSCVWGFSGTTFVLAGVDSTGASGVETTSDPMSGVTTGDVNDTFSDILGWSSATLDFTLIRGLDSLFVRDSDNRTLISGFFDLFGSLELDSLTM